MIDNSGSSQLVGEIGDDERYVVLRLPPRLIERDLSSWVTTTTITTPTTTPTITPTTATATATIIMIYLEYLPSV